MALVTSIGGIESDPSCIGYLGYSIPDNIGYDDGDDVETCGTVAVAP